MKYIVDLPQELAKKIDILISQCRYESISQFANVAFQNQLMLENDSKGSIEQLVKNSVSQTNSAKELVTQSALVKQYSAESIRTVSPPNSTAIPNDCLWGQYNRVFPVKISLRVLASLLKTDETIPLSKLQIEAVEAAREVGLILRKEDKKNRRKYGDMLSSALPIGRSLPKTEKRFINHFVGYYTRAGRIEGAPGALKLLNIIDDGEETRVGITEVGLKFSNLSNPVLDENNLTRTLSKEESIFYIDHIFHNLEREWKLNYLILKALNSGNPSPTQLNDSISELSRGWSQAMVSTIRAGAISRLAELGAVTRLRRGVDVTYSLTPYGKDVIKTFGVSEEAT